MNESLYIEDEAKFCKALTRYCEIHKNRKIGVDGLC